MNDKSTAVFLDTSIYFELIAERQAALERVTELDRKIKAAEMFIPAEMRSAGHQASPQKTGKRSRSKTTITGTIEQATIGEIRGVSYKRLRELLKKSISKPVNDRAFHRALHNLRTEGRIVCHQEHAFEPSCHAKHMARVAKGEIEDLVPERNVLSPITRAVLAYLEEANTWVPTQDILVAIMRIEEVKKLLTPVNTVYYNTMSRLVSRGQLLKDEKTKSYKLPQAGDGLNEDSPASEAGLFADEVAPSSSRKTSKEVLH